MPKMLKNCWGTSHVGYKRQCNEDRYLIEPLQDNQAILLGVADGVAGEAGGEIAAQIVVDTLQKYQTLSKTIEQDMVDLLDQAGKKIILKGEKDMALEGMGTTATVALITDQTAYWSHVGDSRLSLYRNGVLKQVTTDHTFVQDLIDDGTLTQFEASRHPLRNMLDQCVGCPVMAPDSGSFPVLPGDMILLCSDGLSRQVPEDVIISALKNNKAQKVSEQLVSQALEAGGKDNVTVVVLNYSNDS